MRTTSRFWLIATPLGFFLKDVIATIALLATEPGITAKASYYYALALLPGPLVFDDAGSAMVVNVIFGALVGLIPYLLLKRRRTPDSK
jgi:hypothetical protein